MNQYLLLDGATENKLLNYIPEENILDNIALFFQNFADNTRLKILTCLSMSELCVNDLSTLLGINQTTISHQLKNLKCQNIIKCNRVGKILKYSLCNAFVNDILLYAVNSIS